MTATDPKLDEFLAGVRRCGLFDPAAVDRYLQENGTPATHQLLANRMIRDGLLTNFQARMLLDGKSRGFVANGKYKILELVAVGGMGAVYLCEHNLMRRLVAIKVLPKEMHSQAGSAERFLREARAAAALDHPNLVRAFDLDRLGQANQYCLVMEYVDGVNLQVLVEKSGPLPVSRAVDYTLQAAAGLHYAHQAGLIHRDVKPANLLVSRQGVVKLLDLGLARFFADSADNLTTVHSGDAILGTADYMPPEQALQGTVDTRGDLYSLGATLYYLLAGHPPYTDGTVRQKLVWLQTRDPEPLERVRPTVPAALSAVVAKLMARNPNDRYPDLRAAAEALRPFVSGPTPPPDAAEIPGHCPLVEKLLAAAAKAGSGQVPVGWGSLSSGEFTVPAAPPGSGASSPNNGPTSGVNAGTIDLTDLPTFRGRRIDAGGTTATPNRTLSDTRPTPALPATPVKGSSRWAIVGGVVLGLAFVIGAFAANQANRPPEMPAGASKAK